MLDLRRLLRTRSAYAGRFDASGRSLVFVADLGGVPQVWALGSDIEGGWPELLVAPPDRAQTIHLGPQPGQLLVGADVGGNEHTQLLYVAESGADWVDLTEDPQQIFHPGSFSPDGRRISYAANTRSDRWFDIYVRDLESDQLRQVLEHDSSNRAGPFSPDGRWLIVTRLFATSHQELWLVDLQGNDAPRLLTDTDQQAQYQRPEWTTDGSALHVLTDVGQEFSAPARLDLASGKLTYLTQVDADTDELAVDPTGRRLAFVRNCDGAAEVIVRDLSSQREHRVEGLPPGALYDYWQHALAWSPDGSRLAIAWTGSCASPNIWTWSDGQPARQVTFAGAMDTDGEQLVEPEHIGYPTFDGRQIPALLYSPATVNSSAKPPCVVFVHGGPEGQFRPNFQPLVQYLASAGFAVLAPNVRGSSGYGRSYQHLDDVRRRMDSVADLAHAVYWLRDSGRADPARIGVYGGSYGGFMVLSALTMYPDLWAAGVDVVGIGNFVTFLENTGPWRRHLREAEYGSLEHDRDFLIEISPIKHVDNIRAPLLVIHGANDPRVPIGEAEQMVARLKDLGRTVEFLRLEDEGHQIAKLKNKLVAVPLAADFLERNL